MDFPKLKYSYVEGGRTTQPETGMSKIIEGLHVFLNHHQKNILNKVQLKNAFVTGLTKNYNQ